MKVQADGKAKLVTVGSKVITNSSSFHDIKPGIFKVRYCGMLVL